MSPAGGTVAPHRSVHQLALAGYWDHQTTPNRASGAIAHPIARAGAESTMPHAMPPPALAKARETPVPSTKRLKTPGSSVQPRQEDAA
jgi:hypothetical protein